MPNFQTASMIERNFLLAIHGVIMAVGWLVLVPAGMWMGTVGKRRHPEHWLCLHAFIMGTATVLILMGAFIAWSITVPHLGGLHGTFGIILDVALFAQALGGLYMYSRYDHDGSRPLFNRVGRIIGFFIYLGGLINGTLGLKAYADQVTCPQIKYSVAFTLGFMTAVQLVLLRHIIPAWWEDCNDSSTYDAILDQESPV